MTEQAAGMVSLWGYFIKCIKKCVDFRGRARRREFWAYALFSCLFSAAAFVGAFCMALIWYQDGLALLILMACALFLLPGAAVFVRRVHDTGKSGRYILIPAAVPAVLLSLCIMVLFSGADVEFLLLFLLPPIPIIYTLALVWLCRGGEVGPNRYGPNPKAATHPGAIPPAPRQRRRSRLRAALDGPDIALTVLIIAAVLANFLCIIASEWFLVFFKNYIELLKWWIEW